MRSEVLVTLQVVIGVVLVGGHFIGRKHPGELFLVDFFLEFLERVLALVGGLLRELGVGSGVFGVEVGEGGLGSKRDPLVWLGEFGQLGLVLHHDAFVRTLELLLQLLAQRLVTGSELFDLAFEEVEFGDGDQLGR